LIAKWLDVSGANICRMDAAIKPSGMISRRFAQEISSHLASKSRDSFVITYDEIVRSL
jgi:hypothetical protein